MIDKLEFVKSEKLGVKGVVFTFIFINRVSHETRNVQ